MNGRAFWPAWLMLLNGAAVCGYAASDASDALLDCMQEKDDARRLICYDSTMAKVVNATADAKAAGGRKSDTRKTPAAMAPPAVVTRIRVLNGGLRVISLDNGQVWAQLQPVDYFPIELGDTASVTAHSLGSFALSASRAGHRTLPVKRVD
jgi:hypothetical protein